MDSNIFSRKEVNGDQQHKEVPVWQSPLCAWCLEEQGIPAGDGSHGICKKHAAVMLLQYRELKASANPAKG